MRDIVFAEASDMGKARILLEGPAGSGKTYTGLQIARDLVGPEGRIAVIDSDGGASKLCSLHRFSSYPLDGDHTPEHYRDAILAAERQGFDAVVLDSLSLAWAGTRELADRFGDWKKVSPRWRDLIQTIKTVNVHVLATARVKTAWAVEMNERGKAAPVEMGQAPDLGKEAEYEFDAILTMIRGDGPTPRIVVRKSRAAELHGQELSPTSANVGEIFRRWYAGLDTWDSAPFEAEIRLSAGISLGEAARICRSLERPAPLAMSGGQREIFTRWLGTEEGRRKASAILERALEPDPRAPLIRELRGMADAAGYAAALSVLPGGDLMRASMTQLRTALAALKAKNSEAAA